MPLTDRVLRLVNEAVSARARSEPLALSRLIVGLAALLKAWAMYGAAGEVLGDGLRVPHVAWMPDMSLAAAHPAFVVWVVAAVAFLAGLYTRIAGAVLAGSIAFIMLMDQQLYSNHTYLLIIIVSLLTLADSGAAFSIDAKRGGRREQVAAWPVTLLKVQLTIVYGFAAIAKLNIYYLSGSVLNAFWNRTGVFALPDAIRRVEVFMPLAILTIVLEGVLAIGLWHPQLRRPLFAAGFVMHLVIVATMGPALELTVFALAMFSLYVLFLDAAPKRRTLETILHGGIRPQRHVPVAPDGSAARVP